MAGQRTRIDIKRADAPNNLIRKSFELEEEVYDVIQKAKQTLKIESNEEIEVTTGEGLKLKHEDYAKKLCEVEWRSFILKPLPKIKQAGFTLPQAVSAAVKKNNENDNEEIRILQKKFLYNGLKGFDLKIVPESLSSESFSWSHEQQFLSDEEMSKEDQSSEEIAKNKSFKGNLGASFSGVGLKIGGEYNRSSTKKRTKLHEEQSKDYYSHLQKNCLVQEKSIQCYNFIG